MIKKYIEFAIENGYDTSLLKKETHQRIHVDNSVYNCTLGGPSFYETITSKEFIEAIMRGKFQRFKRGETPSEIEMDIITRDQALAIRDGKLDEFIEQILPKQ